VLQARSQSQLDETIVWITANASPKTTGALIPQICDLSSYADVKRFCAEYLASGRPLHALVNNAASSPGTRTETIDGLEMQWQVNIYDYWLLAELLWPVLAASGKKGDPSRVVNVASYYAGGLDVTDVEWKTRKYENNAGYTQSKQANRMLSAIAC
jgi:NAD(P)-dependent dehydrogenase (short-subunit alcohol dehydrogenase family)